MMGGDDLLEALTTVDHTQILYEYAVSATPTPPSSCELTTPPAPSCHQRKAEAESQEIREELPGTSNHHNLQGEEGEEEVEKYYEGSSNRKKRMHNCSYCPKTFSSRHYLRFHESSVHVAPRAALCQDCGRAFGSK